MEFVMTDVMKISNRVRGQAERHQAARQRNPRKRARTQRTTATDSKSEAHVFIQPMPLAIENDGALPIHHEYDHDDVGDTVMQTVEASDDLCTIENGNN